MTQQQLVRFGNRIHIFCPLHLANIPPISVTYSNCGRGRGRESAEPHTRLHTHTPERSHRGKSTDRVRARGSFGVFALAWPQPVPKMWTEVGRLVLLQLFLTELRCADGKRRYPGGGLASPPQSETRRGIAVRRQPHLMPRAGFLRTTHTWIAGLGPHSDPNTIRRWQSK